MAARNISLEMDIADSSSESGVAESVGEEEQLQQTEDNSLGNHFSSEMDTPNGQSLQPDEDAILIQDLDVEDDFKAEWIDVIQVPLLLLTPQSRQIVRFQGETHRWKGIDWSTLMLVQQPSFQVGAFLGYDEQPYRMLNDRLEVQYQYYIVEDDDGEEELIMEGRIAQSIEISSAIC